MLFAGGPSGHGNRTQTSRYRASSQRISRGLNTRASLCEDDILSMDSQNHIDNEKDSIRTSSDAVFFGDPYGNRTHVTAVKGPCLNLLTNGPGSGNWT